jgi:two-component system phosphate regulon response regulator PhoB
MDDASVVAGSKAMTGRAPAKRSGFDPRGDMGPRPSASLLQAGDLQLDCEHRRAYVKNKLIALAPNEMNLLRCLLEARGQVASRALLYEKIANSGRARLPKLQSVDMHIKRLRQKLGDVGKSILTVRNVGYRFEVCREWIDQDIVR